MIRNYQDWERIQAPKVPTYEIATIAGTQGGIRYRLNMPDGTTTQKYYTVVSGTYTTGQRVKIQKVNGTYVIIGAF